MLAVVLMFQLSTTFRERMTQVGSEVAMHRQGSAQETSSGARLEYWRASLQAIAEQPLFGHGAGSWNQAYLRLKGPQVSSLHDTASDPHQLFLLWAVEGGLLGLALLCAVLATLWRYGSRLAAADGHALQSMVLALVISGLFNSMIYGIGMGDFFASAWVFWPLWGAAQACYPAASSPIADAINWSGPGKISATTPVCGW